MLISFCKHRFMPDGSCSECGIVWTVLQNDLRKQVENLRMRTARESWCDRCAQSRMLFSYRPGRDVSDSDEMPTLWLCVRDWGRAKVTEEATGFIDIHHAFSRTGDDQLVNFAFGRIF